MKFLSAATAAAVVAGSTFAAASPLTSSGERGQRHLAPLYTPPNIFGKDAGAELGIMGGSDGDHEDSHIIPDSYIVIMKEGHGHRLPFHVGQVERRIRATAAAANTQRLSARGGFFEDVIEEVRHHFDVADFKGYAGRFSKATLDFIRAHPSVELVERDTVVKTMDVENGAPWGLARISHRPHLRLSTL